MTGYIDNLDNFCGGTKFWSFCLYRSALHRKTILFTFSLNPAIILSNKKKQSVQNLFVLSKRENDSYYRQARCPVVTEISYFIVGNLYQSWINLNLSTKKIFCVLKQFFFHSKHDLKNLSRRHKKFVISIIMCKWYTNQ